MSDELALVDANVLVYAHFRRSEHHAASQALLTRAQDGEFPLCVASQVLAEFYSVTTNARQVSNPFEPAEAVVALERILAMPGLVVLEVPADVPARWLTLARQREPKGPAVFDLQLIATMQANGVQKVYTYDTEHFSGFDGIEPLTP
jgi:toxin-antitoxin system PIN domain toxin